MERHSGPRMTLSTRMVLQALLDASGQEMYGLEICKAANLPSGTIHPILARLDRWGWLESSWEDIDPVKEGRPRRRYYHLNGTGAVAARAALDRVENPGIVVLRPGLTGGA
jgi:PadR family transcriptional regulator, regulatory protein PadR